MNVTAVVAPGFTMGEFSGLDMKGWTIGGDIGANTSEYSSFGVHMAFGKLSGHYRDAISSYDVGVVPVSLELYGRGMLFDRAWAEIGFGMHVDVETQDAANGAGAMGFSVMAQAGVDILKIDRHRFGGYLRLDEEIVGDAAYSATTFGVAYRY
jgi:hypothetical protein